METFTYNGKTYEIDFTGFLLNPNQWDENYAEGMAIGAGILHGLTKEHWDVINFIRSAFEDTGKCPLFYETSIVNGLHLSEMKRLFPSGYLRGACKLAGLTYKEGFLRANELPIDKIEYNIIDDNRTYEVDIRGFLVHPDEWNEFYAVCRAHEMKIPGGMLTEKHWQIIRYLRECYNNTNEVPTVYETCEANKIALDELEQLFPDGYHRGVVKIAGLRVR